MRTISFREFQRKLKKCNPELIIKPGPGKTAAILRQERTEYADGRGLHHILNMPNPRKFLTFRPMTWFEQTTNTGRKELHRGWMDVVRLLVGQGYIRKRDAHSVFSLVRI